MAGGDAKALQYFNRYASPGNVGKALLAIRGKMDAGEIVRSKPDGEDEVALNEWRAQAGIPATPEGYLEKLPNGLVIGEDDKGLADDFLKTMHDSDAPPGYVHKALEWHQALKERLAVERAEADKNTRAQSEDTLRSKWGPEYRANLTAADALLKTLAPEGVRDKFYSARTADGVAFGDDPEVLEFLVSIAREINPHGSVVPVGGAAGAAMTTEMESIRAAMADSNSAYYRGPRDANGETAMSKRYQELIAIQQRGQGRAA